MSDDKHIEVESPYRPTDPPEIWVRETIFCPCCGSEDTVYMRQGADDFYEGAQHLCIADDCNTTFTIPSLADGNESDEKRILAIREAVAKAAAIEGESKSTKKLTA